MENKMIRDNRPACDCSCAVKTEPEKKIVHFNDSYNETTKTVQITAEQEKLLDWLINQDYLNSDISVNDGYPEVEDLT